jgi:16S rRNA processing protein RimM
VQQHAKVAIGYVSKPHGLRGMVTLHPYIYDLQLVPDLSQCQVTLQHATAPSLEVTIAEWQVVPKRILMRVHGCEDLPAATQFRGYEVCIPQHWFPPLPAGEYYWFEIEGLAVYASDGTYVGKIAEIIYTGSNDVYVVQDGAQERLIPALKEVVRRIDLQAGAVHLFPHDTRWA